MTIEHRSPATIPWPLLKDRVGRVCNTTHVDAVTWTWQSIYKPLVPTTYGVYFLTGTARDGDCTYAWELVLKLLAPRPDEHMPWEAALYASGFLATLRSDLRAPRCYGVDTLADGSTAIWLEHVQDAPWNIDDVVRAAYHLGSFTAYHHPPDRCLAGRPLPHWTWRAAADSWRENVAELQAASGHPVVRRAYPASVVSGLLQLWTNHEPILAALDRMPQVLCHGDAQRRNLFVHARGVASTQTIAVDWSNLSLRPLGNDVATLLHQGVLYFDLPAAEILPIDHALVAAFADGFVAFGGEASADLIAYSVAAQLTLGCGLSQVRPFLRLALHPERATWAEEFYGRPMADIIERHASLSHYLAMRAQFVVDGVPRYR